MPKTTFTYIVMKNGRIGVVPPGSHIRDNPTFFNSEPEAIRAVLSSNVGRKMDIRFDDTCVNGKAPSWFNPNEFRKTCMERQKTYSKEPATT